MDISLNNGANKGLGVRHETLDASLVSGLASAATQQPTQLAAQSPSPLTITHATATPEDIAAAEIPDAALSRDDALGKLVSGVFSLQPPPMPAFQDMG